MALTQSLIARTNAGALNIEVWDISPDAAATSFASTMNNILFAQVTVASGVTDATLGVFTENELPAGTAAAGNLAMTSVVASGEYKYRCVLWGSA